MEQSGIIKMIGNRLYFEIYQEDHKSVLSHLTAELGIVTHNVTGYIQYVGKSLHEQAPMNNIQLIARIIAVKAIKE